MTSTLLTLIDSLALIYLPLIYQFGKDWWIVFWLSMAISIVAILPLVIFVRESPKFLVSVRSFSRAREVYRFISKVNRKEGYVP